MVSFEEALECIRDQASVQKRRPAEWINVKLALGRILAQDVESDHEVPSCDNSAMDGILVCSNATLAASEDRPMILDIEGVIACGDSPLLNPCTSACYEIMTGAPFAIYSEACETPLDERLDACIRLEDYTILPGLPRRVRIIKPVARNKERRRKGEDIQIGKRLMRSGQKIHAEHIMTLSAAGVARIKVQSVLNVGVLATGKELMEIDQTQSIQSLGRVFNSNGPYLVSALQEVGFRAEELKGGHPDNAEEFQGFLSNSKGQYDALVTTGAVSKGKFDFILSALQQSGGRVLFHRVTIRPGSPMLFGLLQDGTPLFSLPGNPIASAACLQFLVSPFLHLISTLPIPKDLPARLDPASLLIYKSHQHMRQFLLATLQHSPTGQLVASILPKMSSSSTFQMSLAHGWINVAEGTILTEGSVAAFRPFRAN